MKFTIDNPALPESEFSPEFAKGMTDRMATSHYKYGKVADAYPDKVDAIKSLKLRLDKYERTGNREYLMDVANFAMIEFMFPRHPDAHYTPTDSSGSPGRFWIGEVDPSQRGNRPEQWKD